jgi:Cu/Ag efflux protein CusF
VALSLCVNGNSLLFCGAWDVLGLRREAAKGTLCGPPGDLPRVWRRMRVKRCLIAFAGLWFAALSLAATTGDGEGTVIDVDRDGGSILIDHGQIGSIMGPMTMSFSVDDKSLLAGVRPGDNVQFTMEWRQPDEFVITKMRIAPCAELGGTCQ